MGQDDIIVAKLVDPPATEPPSKSRWLMSAVLSWMVPLVACVVAMLLALAQWDLAEHWTKWMWLAVLVAIGLGLSIVALRERSGGRITATKINAAFGLVASILAVCWVTLCFLAVLAHMHYSSPEGRRELAEARKQRMLELRAEALERQNEEREWQNEEQMLLEQERQLREEQAREAFRRERKEQIADRDPEVARRFQQGMSREPLPIVDRDEPGHSRNDRLPIPIVEPQPLVSQPLTVSVTKIGRDLAEPSWWFVDGLKVQRLNFEQIPPQPALANERPRSLAEQLRPGVLWAGNDSPLVYMLAGDTLLEIDSRRWRWERVVALGGQGLNMARCRDGIVVATTAPGRIIVLDAQTLRTRSAYPVPDIDQVVAAPANNRLFVRTNSPQRYTLAVLNLDTKKIEHLLTPQDAMQLGGKDRSFEEARNWHEFRDLGVTADGKFLWAVSDYFCRWSIDNGKLRCLERGVAAHYERDHYSTSPDGRFVACDHALLDVNKSVAEHLLISPGKNLPWCGIAPDGRIYNGSQTGGDLQIVSPDGRTSVNYTWFDSNSPRATKSVQVLPTPGTCLVSTASGWFAASLREDEPAAKRQATPLFTTADTWPTGGAPIAATVIASGIKGLPYKQFGDASRACFSGDGATIYCAGKQTLSRIGVEDGRPRGTVQLPAQTKVDHLLFSAAGVVVIGGQPSRMWVLDPETLAVRRSLSMPSFRDLSKVQPAEVATSPAHSLLVLRTLPHRVATIDLATGELVGEAALQDLATGTTRNDHDAHREVTLRFSPDGRYLVALIAGRVYRFNLDIRPLRPEESSQLAADGGQCWISGDGRLVAIGSRSPAGITFFAIDDFSQPLHRFDGVRVSNAATLDFDGRSLIRTGLVRYRQNQEEQLKLAIPTTITTGRPTSKSMTYKRMELSPAGDKLLGVAEEGVQLVDIGGERLPTPQPPQPHEIISRIDFEKQGFSIADADRSIATDAEPRDEHGVRSVEITLPQTTLPQGWDGEKRFHLSPDDQWLYIAHGISAVHQVDIKTLKIRRTLTLAGRGGIVRIGAGSGGLAIHHERPRSSVWLVDYDTLEPRSAWSFAKGDFRYAVAADVPLLFFSQGDRLTVIALDTGKAPASEDFITLAEREKLTPIQNVGTIRPAGNGKFVLCLGNGICNVTWDGKSLRRKELPDFERVRAFNELYWHTDSQRFLGLKRVAAKTPSDKRSYFELFNSTSPTERVTLPGIPFTSPATNELIFPSGDRAFLARNQFSSDRRCLAMVTYNGDVARVYPFAEEVLWMKPLARGPQALVGTRDKLFWLTFDETPADAERPQE